jgi:hypothetical protein
VGITQQPPTSVTAGSGFVLQAAIEDAYGNVETGDNATVTVGLAGNPGGSTLGGTLSATATQGVAMFTGLTLNNASSGYTIQVSSGVLTFATTTAIKVIPGPAVQVVITEQPPSSVKVNTGFGLQAAIEDAYGNVVSIATQTVKVALGNNPAGGKLGGTLSEKANDGLATFSGLTINKAASGYTLQVTCGSLAPATTNAITVTSSSSVVPAAVGGAPDVLLAPLVFDSPDLWDGVALNKRSR